MRTPWKTLKVLLGSRYPTLGTFVLVKLHPV